MSLPLSLVRSAASLSIGVADVPATAAWRRSCRRGSGSGSRGALRGWWLGDSMALVGGTSREAGEMARRGAGGRPRKGMSRSQALLAGGGGLGVLLPRGRVREAGEGLGAVYSSRVRADGTQGCGDLRRGRV